MNHFNQSKVATFTSHFTHDIDEVWQLERSVLATKRSKGLHPVSFRLLDLFMNSMLVAVGAKFFQF